MEDRFQFRVWKGKENRMVYGVTYLNPLILDPKIDPENVHNKLMQCTGLKDKNGKLIYEGDIVKMYGWWDAAGPAGYEKDTCVVEFNESVCGFTPMCNYDCDCCVYHDAEECEVIGNIYQDKELLNE